MSWQHLSGVANGIDETLKIFEAPTKAGSVKNSHFEATKVIDSFNCHKVLVVHKPDGNVRLTLHFASNAQGKLVSQKIIAKEAEAAPVAAAAAGVCGGSPGFATTTGSLQVNAHVRWAEKTAASSGSRDPFMREHLFLRTGDGLLCSPEMLSRSSPWARQSNVIWMVLVNQICVALSPVHGN